MSYVIRAVKSPDFWVTVALLSIIGATIASTMSDARSRNDPDYDPCAKYVDMPMSAASCYEHLLEAKEAKAKFKALNQTQDASR